MARLYPVSINKSISGRRIPQSETLFFNMLQALDKEKTKDWYFFFSVHMKQKKDDVGTNQNECDFVGLIPNLGIFAFEVKGGRIVYDAQTDTWSSINKNNRYLLKTSPYIQVNKNYSVLLSKLGISNEYVGEGIVCFADLRREEIKTFISNGHDTFYRGEDFYKFINDAALRIKSDTISKVPTKDDIELLVEKLKGEFNYESDIKAVITNNNETINLLTKEQKQRFNDINDNKRLLISGIAGTGKRELCKEICSSLLLKNETFAYLSFNKVDTIALELGIDNKDKLRVVKPFMVYLKDELKRYPNAPKEIKNDEEIINAYNRYCIKNQKKYKYLIINEAQELSFSSTDTKTKFLRILNDIVEGGLKDGNVYIFYDDVPCYNNEVVPLYDYDEFGDYGYRYTKFKLSLNCRNCYEIQKSIKKLIENKLLDDNSNDNCQIFSSVLESVLYSNACKCIDKLLNDDKINAKDIVLLTYLSKEKNKVLDQLVNRYHMNEYKPTQDDKGILNIRYSSIEMFKGLESEIIIYLRMFGDDEENYRLDYYAISRARSFCYIFNSLNVSKRESSNYPYYHVVNYENKYSNDIELFKKLAIDIQDQNKINALTILEKNDLIVYKENIDVISDKDAHIYPGTMYRCQITGTTGIHDIRIIVSLKLKRYYSYCTCIGNNKTHKCRHLNALILYLSEKNISNISNTYINFENKKLRFKDRECSQIICSTIPGLISKLSKEYFDKLRVYEKIHRFMLNDLTSKREMIWDEEQVNTLFSNELEKEDFRRIIKEIINNINIKTNYFIDDIEYLDLLCSIDKNLDYKTLQKKIKEVNGKKRIEYLPLITNNPLVINSIDDFHQIFESYGKCFREIVFKEIIICDIIYRLYNINNVSYKEYLEMIKNNTYIIYEHKQEYYLLVVMKNDLL